MGTKVSSTSPSTSTPATSSPLQSSSRFWSMSCIPSRRTNSNSIANKQEVKNNITTRQNEEQNGLSSSRLGEKSCSQETKFRSLHLRTYTRVPIDTLITYEECRLPSLTLYLSHIPVLLQDIQYMWNTLLHDDTNINTMTDNNVILPSTIAEFKTNAEMQINKFVASGKYEKRLKQLCKHNRSFTVRTPYNQAKKTENKDSNHLHVNEKFKVINANTNRTTEKSSIEEEENDSLQKPFVLLFYKIGVSNNNKNDNVSNMYKKKVKKLFMKNKDEVYTPKLTAVHLLSLLEMFLWNLPEPLIPFLISRQMENAMMQANSAKSHATYNLTEDGTKNKKNKKQNCTSKTIEESSTLEGKFVKCINSHEQHLKSNQEEHESRMQSMHEEKEIRQWQCTSAWKEFVNESNVHVNSYHTYCFIMEMLQRHINEITRHEMECVLQAIFHDASGECKRVICDLLNEYKPTTLIKSRVQCSENTKNTNTGKEEENTNNVNDNVPNSETVYATIGNANDVKSEAVCNTESKHFEHLDDDIIIISSSSEEHAKQDVCHKSKLTIKAQEADNSDNISCTSGTSNSSSSVAEVDKLTSNTVNNIPCKEGKEVTNNKSNTIKRNEDNYAETEKETTREIAQDGNMEEKQTSEELLFRKQNELDREGTKQYSLSVEEWCEEKEKQSKASISSTERKEENVSCTAKDVKNEQKEVQRKGTMYISSTSSSSTTTAVLPEDCTLNESKALDSENAINENNECNEQNTSELHSGEIVKMKPEQVHTVRTPIVNELATFDNEEKETKDNSNNNINSDNNTIKTKTSSSISTNDVSKEKCNEQMNGSFPIHRGHERITSDTEFSSRLLEHISPVKQATHVNTNVSIEGEELQEEEQEQEVLLLQTKTVEKEEQHELFKKELQENEEEHQPEYVQQKLMEELQHRVELLEQKKQEEEEQLKEAKQNFSKLSYEQNPSGTKSHVKEQLPMTEHNKAINTKINVKEKSMLQTNESPHSHHHHNYTTEAKINAIDIPLIRHKKETEVKQVKRKQSERANEQTTSEWEWNKSNVGEHKYRKGFAKMSDMHKMYPTLQALECAKRKFMISVTSLPSEETASIKTRPNTSSMHGNTLANATNFYQMTKQVEGEDVAENEQEINSINTKIIIPLQSHEKNTKCKEQGKTTCTLEAERTEHINKQLEPKETSKNEQLASTHKCCLLVNEEQEEKVNALSEELTKLQYQLSNDLARHANITEREQSLLHKDKDARFADLELRYAKMNKLLTTQVEESKFTHEMLKRLQINMQKKQYNAQTNELINCYS